MLDLDFKFNSAVKKWIGSSNIEKIELSWWIIAFAVVELSGWIKEYLEYS
jgi:hypothetical protein